MSGIACQFPPQITYSDAQQMHGVLILDAAPDLVNELMVRPHPTGVTSHDVQKMILGRCKGDLLVSNEHFSPVEIQLEFAGREDVVLRASEGPPQGSPNARQQFSHRERFRNVIVCPRVETGDDFGFFSPRGQYKNRRGRPVSQP